MTDPSTASRDLTLLAPHFRERVEAAIADCAAQGYDVGIAEAGRTNEHQAWLYAQGRTRGGKIVTNAPTALTSWHGYFLAIDFMDRKKGFDPLVGNDEPWFAAVAAIFKKHGLDWGGDWHKPDTPHIQFGGLPASPQAIHKSLKQSQGNAAVWRLVGAADPDFHGSESAAVRTLRKGMSGDDVKTLQVKLGLAADGVFGLATEAAVKAFQSTHGLPADGVVGKLTKAALNV